jgi:hypothetical protein
VLVCSGFAPLDIGLAEMRQQLIEAMPTTTTGSV